jgi:hypothetical protein
LGLLGTLGEHAQVTHIEVLGHEHVSLGLLLLLVPRHEVLVALKGWRTVGLVLAIHLSRVVELVLLLSVSLRQLGVLRLRLGKAVLSSVRGQILSPLLVLKLAWLLYNLRLATLSDHLALIDHLILPV